MENLFIEGSETLPTIQFNTNGDLKIKGRALIENAIDFFDPIIAWIKKFPSENITLEINMDYFNTAVSKQMHDLFKALEDNENITSPNIKWYYEEGDDEILESGEIYEELFPDLNFTFHQYAETID